LVYWVLYLEKKRWRINMKLSELEFFVEDFLTFCQNKNLSRKRGILITLQLKCHRLFAASIALLKVGYSVETQLYLGSACV
jgi:hypothetical protein